MIAEAFYFMKLTGEAMFVVFAQAKAPVKVVAGYSAPQGPMIKTACMMTV
jgi:hypothetical protein